MNHLPALALWLVVQLGALLVPVLQAPLSDQFPRPRERVAVQEMVVVQVAAGALLFPLLFKHWTTTVMLVACSWPFIQLTGILSSAPPPHLIWAAAYISALMAMLGIWGMVLKSGKARLLASAVITSLTLGGAMLAYLRAEFGGPERLGGVSDGLLGPLMGVLTLLRGQTQWQVWVPLAAATVASVIVAAARRKVLAARANLSTANPQQDQ